MTTCFAADTCRSTWSGRGRGMCFASPDGPGISVALCAGAAADRRPSARRRSPAPRSPGVGRHGAAVATHSARWPVAKRLHRGDVRHPGRPHIARRPAPWPVPGRARRGPAMRKSLHVQAIHRHRLEGPAQGSHGRPAPRRHPVRRVRRVSSKRSSQRTRERPLVTVLWSRRQCTRIRERAHSVAGSSVALDDVVAC